MATKKIKQFTYNVPNSPNNKEKAALISGDAFADEMGSARVTAMGIQAMPGVAFRTNQANDLVYIGLNGIYEIDLREVVELTSLSFTSDSIDLVDNAPGAYIIVDLVLEDK